MTMRPMQFVIFLLQLVEEAEQLVIPLVPTAVTDKHYDES